MNTYINKYIIDQIEYVKLYTNIWGKGVYNRTKQVQNGAEHTTAEAERLG